MCGCWPANFKEFWVYYGSTFVYEVHPLFRWIYYLAERLDWLHPKHIEDPTIGFVPEWVYKALMGNSHDQS
jgi:hypothetical protein